MSSIEATLENCQRLLRALVDARLGTTTLTSAEKILANEITIFKDRIRIDVQTRTPGIEFADVWHRHQQIVRGDYELLLLDLPDLIASKQAAGRDVDLADVRALTARPRSEHASSNLVPGEHADGMPNRYADPVQTAPANTANRQHQ